MSDLVEFLLARVAEDEVIARHEWDELQARALGAGGLVSRLSLGEVNGVPVTCIDHTRVLAECESKRRIVEEHSDQPGCPHECQGWLDSGRRDVAIWESCPTLRLLALPYADHPDYREEWSP